MGFQPGTILKIHPDYLDVGESPDDRYMVLEDREDRSLVQYCDVDGKFALGSTHVWPNFTFQVDTNPSSKVLDWRNKILGLA